MATLAGRVFETLKRKENYLWEGLAVSLAVHVLLFHAGELAGRLPVRRTVEIDIASMGRLSVPAAPRRATAPPARARPAAPPKEWIRAAPNRKTAPAPAPTKPVVQEPAPTPFAASGGPPGEIGIGTGDGEEGRLARLPQLLNLSDLAAIQRRFYPEQAREDGREAIVVLDIHIDPDGRVTNVEVVQSADPDFDDAAIHVARLLRFSPAYVADKPVAVKMRQAIQFRLQR